MYPDQDKKCLLIIDGITGIDNDLSFGTMSYDDIVSHNFKSSTVGTSLKSLEKKKADGKGTISVLPAIDAEFAEKILAMKPEMLELVLAGKLDEDEMMACKDRLKGVQQLLAREKEADKNRPAGEKKFISGEKEWKDFYDKIEKLSRTTSKEDLKKDNSVIRSKQVLSAVSYIPPDFVGEKVLSRFGSV